MVVWCPTERPRAHAMKFFSYSSLPCCDLRCVFRFVCVVSCVVTYVAESRRLTSRRDAVYPPLALEVASTYQAREACGGEVCTPDSTALYAVTSPPPLRSGSPDTLYRTV